jgi:hypothetical protein
MSLAGELVKRAEIETFDLMNSVVRVRFLALVIIIINNLERYCVEKTSGITILSCARRSENNDIWR